MKSTLEPVSETRVKLTVTVDAADLKPSLDAAYKKIAEQVRIPGFRPGKVPPPIIDQRFGKAAVLEEAIQDAIPRLYTDAVRENDVKPLGQPDVDVTEVKPEGDLTFTAEVDVRPEFELPAYDSLSVTVDAAEPTDDEVTEQLESLRERFATLQPAERAAQEGDFVSIDLVARVDGEELPDGTAKGLSYEVGSKTLVEGLDEAVLGASEGEEKVFTTTLPAGEGEGREAEVTVTVNSVKTKDLPPLDDSFAELASEFETLDELRADVRARLGRVKKQQQLAEARDKIVEALLERVELPLPEAVVKAEVDYRRHAAEHQLQAAGLTLDAYLATEGTDAEAFEKDLAEGAERAVKTQLVLDAIAEKEQLDLNDQDLSEQVVRHAQREGVPPEQFQEYADHVVRSGRLPALVGEVLRGKALALVAEQATVTDSNGEKLDLMGEAQAGGTDIA